jgi:hypothetical protein
VTVTRAGVSRLPVLLVLGFLISGAVVIERSPDDDVTPSAGAAPAQSPTVTPDGVLSTAWYCAGGTAVEGGRADETIVITNLGPEPVAARLTVAGDVQPDGSHASAVSELELAPTSTQRVRVADVLVANEPGVTVEVFGGDVLVEHELAGSDDVSVSPCADDAATTWWSPAGTTRFGAQDWVEIYNPFPDDAVVTLRFLLPTESRSPAGARDRVVEGHSRISVPVHDELGREDAVGVEVVATTGRVVVDRTLVYGSDAGVEGIATTLAQPRTSATHTFAGLQAIAGRSAQLFVANPSQTDAIISVDVIGAQTAPIADTLIPPGTLLVIDLLTYDTDTATPDVVEPLLPPGAWVTVVVDTAGSEPVAAEILQESALPDPLDGVEVLRPANAGSTRWVATAPSIDATETVAVSVHNPGTTDAAVQLGVLGQPALTDPALAQVVPAGQTVVVEVPTDLVPPTTTTVAPETTTTTTTVADSTTSSTDTDASTTTTTTDDASTTTAAGETTTSTASEPTTTTAVETTTTTAPPTTTTTSPPFTPAGAVVVPIVTTTGSAIVVTSDAPVVVLRVLIGSSQVAAATAVPGR